MKSLLKHHLILRCGGKWVKTHVVPKIVLDGSKTWFSKGNTKPFGMLQQISLSHILSPFGILADKPSLKLLWEHLKVFCKSP